MAQTIAAQRGTTTVSGGGNTATTLFTQSTGTATRVILNSVVVKHGEAQLDRLALCINVNGTGNYACVALKQVSNVGRSSYGIGFMPGGSYIPLSTVTTNPANYIDRFVQYQIGNSYYVGSRLSSSSYDFAGPNGSYTTMDASPVDFTPSQFWMNSGDSLVVLHYNSNSLTADVLYSFTTITES